MSVVGKNSGLAQGELKCHRCAVCDGYGCPGMLPGLGGVFEGKNFQLNCEGWKELFNWIPIAGYAVFAFMLFKLKAHPILVIICGAVFGIVFL